MFPSGRPLHRGLDGQLRSWLALPLHRVHRAHWNVLDVRCQELLPRPEKYAGFRPWLPVEVAPHGPLWHRVADVSCGECKRRAPRSHPRYYVISYNVGLATKYVIMHNFAPEGMDRNCDRSEKCRTAGAPRYTKDNAIIERNNICICT